METLNDGWYRVTLENLKPEDDEVQFYDEWVELKSGEWDLCEYQETRVVTVIKPEDEQ